MTLSPEQRLRYSRQLALPEIGEEGQRRLLASRVLIVGAGGLGSPAALYLAAAGVGTLGIVDPDVVELSNLQRQILHTAADVGRRKVESAAAAIRALNPDVRLECYEQRLTAGAGVSYRRPCRSGASAKRPERAAGGPIIGAFEFVIDATDNFQAKFAIADACHRAGRPYSHAGIRAFFGQTMTVLPGRTACYRCVFEEPPAPAAGDGAPAGPLGVVPAAIGAIQATEAVKCLLGAGRLLTDRLLTYDALAMEFRTVPLKRRPTCPLCGVGAAGRRRGRAREGACGF